MSLPKAFNSEMVKALEARAVWPLGKTIAVGDIMVKRDNLFHKVSHVSSFGITPATEEDAVRELDLKTTKVRQRIFQAGVELPDAAAIDVSAEASVKLEFSGKSQFMLKTPALTGQSIKDMLLVAKEVVKITEWKHDKYFIVKDLYGSSDWSFLGTKESSSNIEISGNGAGIVSFLKVGISVGLKTSGTIDLKMMGKGGSLAMRLVRVKEDGGLDHGS